MSNPLLLSDVCEELLRALKSRSPVIVVRTIAEKCPEVLQLITNQLNCPLHLALLHGADLGVVQYIVQLFPQSLLGFGKDLPLQLALRHNASDGVVLYLIDQNPQALQEKDGWGFLPAHEALDNGASFEVVQAIVEPCPHALRVRNASDQLPLTLALQNYSPERRHGHRRGPPEEAVIRYLVNKCPESLGDEDSWGMRAIHVAAEAGAPPEILAFLLEVRPHTLREATAPGYLPVHYAAESGTRSGFRAFQFLVDLWPESLQRPTGNDDLPLQMALESSDAGHDSVLLLERVRYILDKWPEAIRTKVGTLECIPLHHALRATESLDVLALFLDRWPESIHELSPCGGSVLHFLSVFSTPSVDKVRFLVERDDSIVDARSVRDGSIPLHRFAGAETSEDNDDDTSEGEDDDTSMVKGADALLNVVRFLVERRPESVMARDDMGCLPVHRSVGNRSRVPEHTAAIVRCLVSQRPETLSEKNHTGSIPLHLALRCSGGEGELDPSLELVRVLVDAAPASLQVKDGRGMIPLLVAAMNPTTPLDVLWFLMTAWPGSLSTMMRGGTEGEAALQPSVVVYASPSKRRRLGA